MRRLLCLIFLCSLSANTLLRAQVLTEKATDLGHGFKSIETGQINVPGRWYSDKKFHFLYFEKRRLCQCTQFALAPSGKQIIFQESSDKSIAVFNSEKNQVQIFKNLPAAELKEIKWAKNEKSAELNLSLKERDKEKTILRKVKVK